MEQCKNSKVLADQIRMLPDDKVAIANEEGVYIYAISDLLKQPIEGLLYDFNRDTATNYNRLEQGDMRAVNDIAMAKILIKIMTLNKMTRIEAIAFAISTGKPITHDYFSDNEYVKYDNGILIDEKGYRLPQDEFWALRSGNAWEYGWREYRYENK